MRATFAVAVLFTLGCRQSGLPATGGAATVVDLGLSPSVDAGTADLASPPHLASSCHDAMPNASTSLAGHALAYSWVANSSCDGTPSLARIELEDSDTFDYDSPVETMILATLPLALGPQAVTVYTGLGADEHMADGTLDVTGFTNTPDGIYIDSVQGSIESPTLQLSGSFAADHCAELDIACI
jgi:hypothetical protein